MTTKIAIQTVLAAGLTLVGAVSLTGCAASSNSNPTKAPEAAKGRYVFWPAAPAEPRIQFIAGFNSSEDVSPSKSSGLDKIVFGEDINQTAYVNKPYGLAVRDGRIYVCDIRAKALVVMDLVQKQTRLVGVAGSNHLERPVAVAIADDGVVYVADLVLASIMVFDKSERFAGNFNIPKLKPAALAVRGDRLYVADMTRQQVLILDRRSGKELGAIGSVGDEPGQFRLPVGLTIDKEGNLYVVDTMRCNVQKFTADGAYLGAFGQAGDHAGAFARPKQIAVDSEGILYIVDAAFQNVQLFNDKFQMLMFFGAAGTFPGAMDMPIGIAVSDNGLEFFKDRIHPGFNAKRIVVVANQFGNSKISVYALGERKPEYKLADLHGVSVEFDTGVAKPDAEQLKFQNVGGIEPGAEGAAGGAAPANDAPPPGAKRDDAPPAKPADAKPESTPKN